jgi:hypothetical protein
MRLHEQEPINYDDETFTHQCFQQFVNGVRQ